LIGLMILEYLIRNFEKKKKAKKQKKKQNKTNLSILWPWFLSDS